MKQRNGRQVQSTNRLSLDDQSVKHRRMEMQQEVCQMQIRQLDRAYQGKSGVQAKALGTYDLH